MQRLLLRLLADPVNGDLLAKQLQELLPDLPQHGICEALASGGSTTNLLQVTVVASTTTDAPQQVTAIQTQLAQGQVSKARDTAEAAAGNRDCPFTLLDLSSSQVVRVEPPFVLVFSSELQQADTSQLYTAPKAGGVELSRDMHRLAAQCAGPCSVLLAAGVAPGSSCHSLLQQLQAELNKPHPAAAARGGGGGGAPRHARAVVQPSPSEISRVRKGLGGL